MVAVVSCFGLFGCQWSWYISHSGWNNLQLLKSTARWLKRGQFSDSFPILLQSVEKYETGLFLDDVDGYQKHLVEEQLAKSYLTIY